MKKILTTLLALTVATPFFAQNHVPHMQCGNEIFSQIVREKYPALQTAFEQTFDQAKSMGSAADRSPLTIKVVVHVVWNNPAENLADDIIESQIQILNEDFNRLNADTANLRTVFQPAAGNANIHFQLEEIVRVQTNKLFAIDILANNLLTELKYNQQGGSDAWDTQQYLNLWVCKIQPTTIFGIPVGQILGFAFPPNGLGNWPADSGAPNPNEDGVVIDYRLMGRNNPNPLPNPGGSGNLLVAGRTPVHEIGHYLGLRHIWGDGGLLGPNNCAQSDGVDDTPFANAQSNFDCNKNRNTCMVVEPFYGADVPDLVENFMDYSSETCMNMFTKGQVELMRNVLMGPRVGLLSSSSVSQDVARAFKCTLFPNPSNGQLGVYLDLSAKSDVSLRVLDVAGKIVAQQPALVLDAGATRFHLDGSTWPGGVYFVEIRTPEASTVQKWVKQ